MIFSGLVLFIGTFLGGLVYKYLPSLKQNLSLLLVFVGSYLFAITVIHLIPEVFSMTDNSFYVGILILAGFFLQQFLEYFSSGIEHGHFHAEGELSSTARVSIIIALLVHSLLEGSILTHDSPVHDHHESHSLLLGIILHKIPAAFALMVTMKTMNKSAYLLLFVFSLASPVGLFFGHFLNISPSVYLVVFAIVCGSFLHISTTIFVETSPNHKFGINKLIVSIIGALIAILAEILF